MVKKITFCLLMSVLCLYSEAQVTDNLFEADEGFRKPGKVQFFKFALSGGFGKYVQSDLKDINQIVHDNLAFETKLTDNFPTTFYWGASLLIRLNRTTFLGPDYQFHTTGSRLAYEDYSGSYTFDQVMSAHSVGVRFEETIGTEHMAQLCLSAILGLNISSWEIREALVAGEVNEGSSVRYTALAPFLYPSVKLRLRINSMFSLAPSIGYNIELIDAKYHVPGNKDAKAQYAPCWKGPRAEISTYLSF